MYIYILKTCIYISMYVNLDFRNNNNFCYYCHSQFLYSKLKFATSRKIYSCLLHLIFQMTFVNVTYWKVQYLKTQILQSMVVLGTHNLFDLNELPSVYHKKKFGCGQCHKGEGNPCGSGNSISHHPKMILLV